MSAKILFIGQSGFGTTSNHRAAALKRLGHKVTIFDPLVECPWNLKNKLVSRFHYFSGFLFFSPILENQLWRWLKIKKVDYDLVWVDSGEWLNSNFVQHLRGASPVILYNNDDPTGNRDGNRFYSLKSAIPYYDLCAVVRKQSHDEFKASGARRVIQVWMSYDEVAHVPSKLTLEELQKYGSEVCFIGSWMSERGPFMSRLLDLGVPLSIWGDHWQKAPEWSKLQACWRGPAVYEQYYCKIVTAAKVMLGLLSKGNRDLHTTRSTEIPKMGGLFCAERTTEHESLFEDWKEAVFWNNAEECAKVCFKLLSNSDCRERIRLAGQQRVLSLRLGN